MSDARLLVSVPWGPQAGLKVAMAPGESLRVGRTERADLAIPQDEQLAAVHFELAWDGASCLLRDLGSGKGVRVAGQPATEATLGDRGWIRAGGTDFVLRIEGSVPDTGGSTFLLPLPPEDEARLPRHLRDDRARRRALRDAAGATLAGLAREDRLHAVLDAARDERIVELLDTSRDRSRSLYEGTKGVAMADQAPYLVRFEGGSRLLDRIVVEGWGARWGIFLVTAQPFKDLRRHLRRLLVVRRDASAVPLLFRFYDPEVLRVFLPICLPGQVADFWGDIDAFLFEGEDGQLVERARPEPPRAEAAS